MGNGPWVANKTWKETSYLVAKEIIRMMMAWSLLRSKSSTDLWTKLTSRETLLWFQMRVPKTVFSAAKSEANARDSSKTPHSLSRIWSDEESLQWLMKAQPAGKWSKSMQSVNSKKTSHYRNQPLSWDFQPNRSKLSSWRTNWRNCKGTQTKSLSTERELTLKH